MLLPALHVTDLRDRPTIIRIGDATFGYGLNGDASRAEVARARLRIEQWTPDPGVVNNRRLLVDTDLPESFWRLNKLVDVNYPAGGSIQGDGLLIFTLSLYSTVAVPVSKATYTADLGIVFNNVTQRFLAKKNGAFVAVSLDNGVSRFSFDATTDIYTDWRIETIIGSTLVTSGTFVVSSPFLSLLDTADSAEAKLIASASQAVLLLSRSRRRLNRLAEKLALANSHLPLPQFMADGLVWLRLHERLAELTLGQDGDRSPYRTMYLLDDFHKTLDPLWHRSA